ncbi:MAG: TM2 domain-containing protein [Gammaproteobacteria bacterium]
MENETQFEKPQDTMPQDTKPQNTMQIVEMMLFYDAQKKSVAIAYFLWFFLGLLGMHRVYLRKWLSGFIMALLGVLYFFFLVTLLGIYASFLLVAIDSYDINTEILVGISNAEILAVISNAEILAGISMVSGVLLIPAIIYGVWWVVDAFLIPNIVQKHNSEIVQAMIADAQ